MRKRKPLDPAPGGRKRDRTARRNRPQGLRFARKNWYLIGTTAPRRSGPAQQKTPGFRGLLRVSDRTRTGDRLDHNQELYQLSYAHRAGSNVLPWVGLAAVGTRPEEVLGRRTPGENVECPRQDSNLRPAA